MLQAPSLFIQLPDWQTSFGPTLPDRVNKKIEELDGIEFLLYPPSSILALSHTIFTMARTGRRKMIYKSQYGFYIEYI